MSSTCAKRANHFIGKNAKPLMLVDSFLCLFLSFCLAVDRKNGLFSRKRLIEIDLDEEDMEIDDLTFGTLSSDDESIEKRAKMMNIDDVCMSEQMMMEKLSFDTSELDKVRRKQFEDLVSTLETGDPFDANSQQRKLFREELSHYFLVEYAAERINQTLNQWKPDMVKDMMHVVFVRNVFGVWVLNQESREKLVYSFNPSVDLGEEMARAIARAVYHLFIHNIAMPFEFESYLKLELMMPYFNNDDAFITEFANMAASQDALKISDFLSSPTKVSFFNRANCNCFDGFLLAFPLPISSILYLMLDTNIGPVHCAAHHVQKYLQLFDMKAARKAHQLGYFNVKQVLDNLDEKVVILEHLPYYETFVNSFLASIFHLATVDNMEYMTYYTAKAITLIKTGVFVEEQNRIFLNQIVFESFGTASHQSAIIAKQFITGEMIIQDHQSLSEFNSEIEAVYPCYRYFRTAMKDAFGHNMDWMLPKLPKVYRILEPLDYSIKKFQTDLAHVPRIRTLSLKMPSLHMNFEEFMATIDGHFIRTSNALALIDLEWTRLTNSDALIVISQRMMHEIKKYIRMTNGQYYLQLNRMSTKLKFSVGKCFGLMAYYNDWNAMIKPWSSEFIQELLTGKTRMGIMQANTLGMGFANIMGENIDGINLNVVNHLRYYDPTATYFTSKLKGSILDVEFSKSLDFFYNSFPLRKTWLELNLGVSSILDRFPRLRDRLQMDPIINSFGTRGELIISRYFQVFKNSPLLMHFQENRRIYGDMPYQIHIETESDIFEFGEVIGHLMSMNEKIPAHHSFYSTVFFYEESRHTERGRILLSEMGIDQENFTLRLSPTTRFLQGIYKSFHQAAHGAILRNFFSSYNDYLKYLDNGVLDTANAPLFLFSWIKQFSTWNSFTDITFEFLEEEAPIPSYVVCRKTSHRSFNCYIDPTVPSRHLIDLYVGSLSASMKLETRTRLYMTALQALPPFRDRDIYTNSKCWRLGTQVTFNGIIIECENDLMEFALQIVHRSTSRVIDFSTIELLYDDENQVGKYLRQELLKTLPFNLHELFSETELWNLVNGIEMPEFIWSSEATSFCGELVPSNQIFTVLTCLDMNRHLMQNQYKHVLRHPSVSNPEDPAHITEFDESFVTLSASSKSFVSDSCAVLNNLMEPIKYFSVLLDDNSYSAVGHFRSWLTDLATILKNEYFPIDIESKVFYPSDQFIKPGGEEYLECFGIVMALMLRLKMPFGFNVEPYFYQILFEGIEKSLMLEELHAIDPSLTRSLYSISMQEESFEDFLQNPYESAFNPVFDYMDFSFSYTKTTDFVFHQDQLSAENFHSYIDCFIGFHLYYKAERTYTLIRKGFLKFVSIIPEHPEFASGYKSIQQILKGNEQINVDEWKESISYTSKDEELDLPYDSSHPNVIRFWNCVEQMANQDRMKLFTFVTALKYVPGEGLRGMKNKVSILYEAHSKLPKSFTCHSYLMLPVIENQQEMCKLLYISIEEGNTFK